MIKVVRLPLIYAEDKNDSDMDYKKVYEVLWDLQKQTRKIKNKVIQLCWEYSNFSSDYKKTFQEYPDEKAVIGKSLRGFVYSECSKSGEFDLYASNLSATTDKSYKEFNNSKAEMFKGTRSIINYNSNQPLEISKKSIFMFDSDGEHRDYYINIKLFSRKGKEKYNLSRTDLTFKALIKDKSSRCIFERCVSGEYDIAGSLLLYNKKKRMWCLNLTYEIPSEKLEHKKVYLDKDKILGVTLDFKYPICASINGDKRRFIINSDEIDNFRKKTEQRRKSLLRQAKYCGDGRIGHGIRTRNRPAYRIEDKIARFQDTANHKYSRALIEFAVQNQCGIIQLEDLKGVSTENLFLKNWSYYDLQTKIEQKAMEYGITVHYVNPNYTSIRCSQCGHINIGLEQNPEFICQKCGYKTDWHYNTSQNISVKDIADIIKADIKEQNKNR